MKLGRPVIAGAAVALVSLWPALPVGAGDPVGQVTEFSADLTPDNGPNRITLGPDGNLWFTEGAMPGQTAKIGRITPTGTVTEFTENLTANSQPVEIAAGPDGNLWFTENANPGRIAKIGAGCAPPPAPSPPPATPLALQPRFTG